MPFKRGLSDLPKASKWDIITAETRVCDTEGFFNAIMCLYCDKIEKHHKE